MSTTSEYSFFQSVEKSFDKASKFTNWETGLLEQIKACNSIYSMRFPVKMDDGRIEVIEAYRVQHSQHKSRNPSQTMNSSPPSERKIALKPVYMVRET